jgi:FlaA1/EpsC-like NDP-sugar epimerase
MKFLLRHIARWRWILWDLVALQGAFAVVLWIRFGGGSSATAVPATLHDYLGPAAWMSTGWLILFTLFGLYRSRGFPTTTAWLTRLFHAVTFGTLALALLTFDPTRPFTEPRTILVGYWAALLVFLGGGRLLPALHEDNSEREESVVVARRRLATIGADAILIVVSYYLAFWLRFDGKIPADATVAFWNTLPLVFLVRFAAFVIFRLYAGLWRYASINDLLSIIKAVSTGTGVLVLPVFFFGIPGYPRSVFLIDWFLLIMFLGGMRFAMRAWRELRPRFLRGGRRILVVGAGDAGEMLVRELIRSSDASLVPVAFVDSDVKKHGSRLHGVPVVGGHTLLGTAARRYRVEEILIAIPSATGAQMREIVAACVETGLPFKTVPSLREIIDGRVSVHQARAVQVDDLLRRSPVVTKSPTLSRFLHGRRVMVTGAAGSIGSELTRRIIRYSPAELILVDRAENALHDLMEEISRHPSTCAFEGALVDVTERARFHRLFADRAPDVIFHAAAYKQVPLAEHYPDAVVLNNVGGSRYLMDWSLERGVGTFVNVSTDKAVCPSSVMGATKRVAELLALRRSEEGKTRFVSVRFGNVLGSSGSVVPLFERQIRAGGPVTVTHPDITRFFMTASEAALLVLQAAAIGDNGHTMVLDMGEPVRVYDLARDLIALSGLRPDRDIRIEFTGLRPGEKMSEELFGDNVTPRRSSHDKIWIVDGVDDAAADFESRVTELLAVARTGDRTATKEKLIEIVPGYQTTASAPITVESSSALALVGSPDRTDEAPSVPAE